MQELSRLMEKKILIYGAGAVARVIVPYVMHNDNMQLIGIAISSIKDAAALNGFNVPVREIQKWEEYSNEAIVLIATSSQYHHQITKTCSNYGFRCIMPLTPEVKDAIIMSYYEDYFKRANISLEGEFIQIGAMKLLNPIKAKIPNGTNIFSQIGDMILPALFNDYKMVAEGPYEYCEVKLQAQDIVIDCGANLGVFSAFAASKGCICYAFEPTPALYPILEQMSILNEKRIIPVAAALSDRTGVAEFYLDAYSCGGSSLLRQRTSHAMRIDVAQTSLDDYVRKNNIERVNFIKADIEGAERLMIAGAKWVLQNFAPKLSICTYHRSDDAAVLGELIHTTNPNYKIQYCWQKLFAYV